MQLLIHARSVLVVLAQRIPRERHTHTRTAVCTRGVTFPAAANNRNHICVNCMRHTENVFAPVGYSSTLSSSSSSRNRHRKYLHSQLIGHVRDVVMCVHGESGGAFNLTRVHARAFTSCTQRARSIGPLAAPTINHSPSCFLLARRVAYVCDWRC